ncbi:EpsI family protein [bacterium]|nr:EpsI family protein [bacterium]
MEKMEHPGGASPLMSVAAELSKPETCAALPIPRRGSALRILALLAFGSATAALCLLTPSPNTAPLAGVIMDLPERIGAFTGKVIAATPGELAILPTDTQIVRREYTDPAGDRIMASIVLSGGEKRSIHRPEVCLPAQGWSMRGGKVERVALADGSDLDVMNLSLVRQVEVGPGDRRNLYAHYFYWFVGKNVTTPNHWRRVFLTSFDRITKNLNHRWAYVIVMSIVTEGFVPGGKNEPETVRMLKEFTGEIAPTFMRKETVSAAD